MKLFPRRARPPTCPATPSFGEWVLRCFAGDGDITVLGYAELERAAANAASLLCAAVYDNPQAMASALPAPEDTAAEAALVARRTADGFKAALADRSHTVLTWPWEHLATRVAWAAARGQPADAAALGLRLLQVGGTYALRHREQAATVLRLWADVAAGLPGERERHADLPAMGRELFQSYCQLVAARGFTAAPARN